MTTLLVGKCLVMALYLGQTGTYYGNELYLIRDTSTRDQELYITERYFRDTDRHWKTNHEVRNWSMRLDPHSDLLPIDCTSVGLRRIDQ